jgi:hypothetical protein
MAAPTNKRERLRVEGRASWFVCRLRILISEVMLDFLGMFRFQRKDPLTWSQEQALLARTWQLAGE